MAVVVTVSRKLPSLHTLHACLRLSHPFNTACALACLCCVPCDGIRTCFCSAAFGRGSTARRPVRACLQIAEIDPTLFVVHTNEAAKPPIMRIRITNDTSRGSDEASAQDVGEYGDAEVKTLRDLEHMLLHDLVRHRPARHMRTPSCAPSRSPSRTDLLKHVHTNVEKRSHACLHARIRTDLLKRVHTNLKKRSPARLHARVRTDLLKHVQRTLRSVHMRAHHQKRPSSCHVVCTDSFGVCLLHAVNLMSLRWDSHRCSIA